MAMKIAPIRAGRPDYSQTMEKTVLPVSPKPVVGKTSTLYWSTVDYIDGETIALLEPVNPEGYPFPTPGKILRVKKVVVTTTSNTLIAVDLRHSGYPYIPGDEYIFARETKYQSIVIEPEAYSIRYPDRFRIFIWNYNPEPIEFSLYWIGSEEDIE